MVEHCRDTLRLGSVRILCGWALQGYSAVGHCRDTWWLGTAGILCGWAHPLSIAGILIGWALQRYLVVGHCRDTLRLGTAGIFGGWSLKSASSRARTTSTLKSNNPIARVGNNYCGVCVGVCIKVCISGSDCVPFHEFLTHN